MASPGRTPGVMLEAIRRQGSITLGILLTRQRWLAGMPEYQMLITKQLQYLVQNSDIRWEHVAGSVARFNLLLPFCYELLCWQVVTRDRTSLNIPVSVSSCHWCEHVATFLELWLAGEAYLREHHEACTFTPFARTMCQEVHQDSRRACR